SSSGTCSQASLISGNLPYRPRNVSRILLHGSRRGLTTVDPWHHDPSRRPSRATTGIERHLPQRSRTCENRLIELHLCDLLLDLFIALPCCHQRLNQKLLVRCLIILLLRICQEPLIPARLEQILVAS